MSRSSGFEARKEGTMSQQLAVIVPDYVELAGSDPRISKKIQRIKNYVKLGWMRKKEAEIMLLFLNGDRMAAFATSEKNSNVTTLGLQMPKARKVIDVSERV